MLLFSQLHPEAASHVSVFSTIKKGVILHNHNPKGIFSSTGRQRRSRPPQIKLAEPAYARRACLPSTAAPMDLFLAPHFSVPHGGTDLLHESSEKQRGVRMGPTGSQSLGQDTVFCKGLCHLSRPWSQSLDEVQEPTWSCISFSPQ